MTDDTTVSPPTEVATTEVKQEPKKKPQKPRKPRARQSHFRVGATVKVTTGPAKGHQGKITDANRSHKVRGRFYMVQGNKVLGRFYSDEIKRV